VVILADNDEPGRRHAADVAQGLRGRAASVRVVHLPGLPPTGDVSDWLAAGGTREQLERLAAAAEPQPHPPDDGEAREGAGAPRPAAKRAARLPEPYRPFPVECLPPPLAGYVRQGALALGCDPAYLALPALAVAAGLIGHTRALQLKRTWLAPSVLWTLVIADSGSLKTPAFRLATNYLFAIQSRLDREFRQELAAYAKAKDGWEAAVKAAKQDGREPSGDKPEPPVQRSVFTSDATIEAIAELIGDNPRGLVVPCDELAGWLGSFVRYKGKAGGTDLQRWLSMHSAGGFAYHRRTGDKRRIIVPHAAVSVCGGIQPGILARALGDEFLAAGLAARLLLAMPPRPAKTWTEAEIDPDTERAYQQALDGLLALDFDVKDGEKVPHVLRLTPDAKGAWVAWYGTWAREQAAAEGELAAALAKLEEAAARFALLHHVAGRVARGADDLAPVEKESIEAGATLCRWFAAEARRVYAVLAESTEDGAARRLVEFIRARGGRITARELQRSNGRKYPNAEVAETALEGLVEAGLARWQERPGAPQGGHRARVLELCPTPDTSDSCPPPGYGAGPGLSDTCPPSVSDGTPPTPAFSRENRTSVGSVGRRTREADACAAPGPGMASAGGSVGQGKVVSDGREARPGDVEEATDRAEAELALLKEEEERREERET
jgi:hypothetical protein